MKKNQILLILIGFILVALMATNPSTEEHKEAVMEKVSAAIEINNSNGNAFRKIAFASVFDAAAKNAFSAFVPFIKLFTASIHLVYVNTPEHFVNSSDAERLMKSFSKGNEELTLHIHVVNDKNSVDGIHSFCVDKGIALVALYSEDKKGKPSYQVGTTETLIFKSDRAVLSIKSAG